MKQSVQLEGIDLSGKTVVPFCTSMSSGAGSSAANLAKLTGDSTTWLNAERISNHATDEQIHTWALSTNKQTISMIIKKFETRDYLTVAASDKDKRNKKVFLTPAGREQFRSIILPAAEAEVEAMRKLSPEDVETLVRLTTEFTENPVHLPTHPQHRPPSPAHGTEANSRSG